MSGVKEDKAIQQRQGGQPNEARDDNQLTKCELYNTEAAEVEVLPDLNIPRKETEPKVTAAAPMAHEDNLSVKMSHGGKTTMQENIQILSQALKRAQASNDQGTPQNPAGSDSKTTEANQEEEEARREVEENEEIRKFVGMLPKRKQETPSDQVAKRPVTDEQLNQVKEIFDQEYKRAQFDSAENQNELKELLAKM